MHHAEAKKYYENGVDRVPSGDTLAPTDIYYASNILWRNGNIDMTQNEQVLYAWSISYT
jgi:hypothetical protein